MANLRTGEMVTSTPGHKSEYIIDNNFTHFLHSRTFFVPIFRPGIQVVGDEDRLKIGLI